ncbi:glycosyl-4,4'-diaponeurosporenoate acyltransferase [Bacillus sp. B1-b2]|uniref:glycosyl-4,4'-diaponeurosporenoate acyltransferase CrtO family protein n=1 Tax=Bacillus sp. B1-b2 TaxID=2653201 RepID=UPI001261838A|nr:glycosyl-4,4'-diaponeurosporenoate acyltransferase [Bacillus sp. B1-b2]KAB7670797.1 glycosyl-4,4'-diaponeurosporenoate acyltransferase [Bacillus sp. B1-b2]
METFIIDIVAWFLIHIGIALVIERLPIQYFTFDTFLYRIRNWEKNGAIWGKWFKVKAWKSRIPDGRNVIGKGFEKKQLSEKNKPYLQQFILESRRAELTHWISIVPAPFFFLWNPPWAGWVMVIYALLFNLPIIMAQRYNRPRIQRIVKRLDNKK